MSPFTPHLRGVTQRNLHQEIRQFTSLVDDEGLLLPERLEDVKVDGDPESDGAMMEELLARTPQHRGDEELREEHVEAVKVGREENEVPGSVDGVPLARMPPELELDHGLGVDAQMRGGVEASPDTRVAEAKPEKVVRHRLLDVECQDRAHHGPLVESKLPLDALVVSSDALTNHDGLVDGFELYALFVVWVSSRARE